MRQFDLNFFSLILSLAHVKQAFFCCSEKMLQLASVQKKCCKKITRKFKSRKRSNLLLKNMKFYI